MSRAQWYTNDAATVDGEGSGELGREALRKVELDNLLSHCLHDFEAEAEQTKCYTKNAYDVG